MDKIVVEKEVVVDGGGRGNGTGSNVAWALAFVVIVGIVVGALYYSGALKRLTGPQQPQKVNVEVSAPAAPAPAAPAR